MPNLNKSESNRASRVPYIHVSIKIIKETQELSNVEKNQ